MVVDAYSQLAAEGYLVLRQGARPKVSEAAVPREGGASGPMASPPVARFDLRPRAPDVSSFPRAAWLRSLREAVGEIADADLLYGDPRGVEALRSALAESCPSVSRGGSVPLTDRGAATGRPSCPPAVTS